MNQQIQSSKAGTATVILLAFLLFYLPSMLTLLSSDHEPRDMMILNILMATCYAGIFCMNYFLIVPKLLFEKESKTFFFLTNLVLVIFLCSLLPLWIESRGGLHVPGHLKDRGLTTGQTVMAYMRFVIRDGVMMILSIALAYALWLSKAREEMRSRMLQLEAERRHSELMNLKAQLNPHFLFNSLNNIYALIAIDPDKAQSALHELSGMLRFMIYDSESQNVALHKEIHFIRDFTRLMSLRLNPSVKLACELPAIHDDSIRIAPLLLLTIVENAFKHVGTNNGEGFISISMEMDEDKFLCKVSNSCQSEPTEILEKGASGVGLKNIEKQLELLYPEAFMLTTGRFGEKYKAELEIKTSALKV